MGLIEEVEEYLKQQCRRPIDDEWSQFCLTEYPKLRYKKRDGWFRRCHRCKFAQLGTCISPNYAAIFPTVAHTCARDSTLYSVEWKEAKLARGY